MSSHPFGMAGLVLALFLAGGLYALKDRVQRIEGELRQVRAALTTERSALNRIRTEWAMLNQPGRLARLANAHLQLVPAHPGQIVKLSEIPFRTDVKLGQRSWQAVLPSGGEIELRFKPPPALSRLAAGDAVRRATRSDP